MNKEYSIFDPEDRPGGRNWDDMDSVYNHPDNNWFMFLNECPGEFGAFCRSRIHTWLDDMPDGGRVIANNLVTKKGGRKYGGDVDDYKFRSWWWEMFVHQIFKHRAVSSEGEVPEGDSRNIDLWYQMPDGSACLVECCILTEGKELQKIASLKTKYISYLLPLIEGSKMSADLTTFSEYYPHSEHALQTAAKFCMNNPMGGKAEIKSSKHHELISTDSIRSYEPPSLLRVVPSETDKSNVRVIINAATSDYSRHLSKLERKLQKKQIQKLGETPFILAATTNLNDRVFDAPAVYKRLYDSESGLFSDQRWNKVSALLLGSPLPHCLDYYRDIPLTLFLNPYASNPVPDCLLSEMPYVVDTEQEQIYHDSNSAPTDISQVRRYLTSEDFDEWDRLRAKQSEERNIAMFPSVLNPEQEHKLQLRWLPKSENLTEEAIDAVNKMMSLYLQNPRIPKPKISIFEENLSIDWIGRQRFLCLSCNLIDKTAEWFGAGIQNGDIYQMNNLEKWEELEKHLLTIMAPQQF